jgi:hypothetical protein
MLWNFNSLSQLSPRKICWLLACGGVGLLLCLRAAANPSPTLPEPLWNDVPPVVVAALKAPTSVPIVSSQTPSQAGLTLPSLWWITQQFGQEMVEQWWAYPGVDHGVGRVDLRVRSDAWSRASFIDRYAFVNHIGLVASDYGYNLLVFDRRQNILSAYLCRFPRETATLPPSPACQIWMNPNFSTRPF